MLMVVGLMGRASQHVTDGSIAVPRVFEFGLPRASCGHPYRSQTAVRR
jgi:hypothetical protein